MYILICMNFPFTKVTTSKFMIFPSNHISQKLQLLRVNCMSFITDSCTFVYMIFPFQNNGLLYISNKIFEFLKIL